MPRHLTSSPTPTGARVRATVEVLREFVAAIKSAGSMGLPSGHLYAAVMQYVELEKYNQLIQILKDTGIVREVNHCLFYVEQAQAKGSVTAK